MADVEVEAAGRYAAADADMTGRLRPGLEEELRRQNLWALFVEVEMPLVPVLARMEMVGVALDVAVLREMSIVLGREIARMEDEIHGQVGHRFNIGSPQQLGQVLFEQLKLPKTRKTKLGYSTDAQALEALRSLHPIIDQILSYRELTKLKSTYVDALPALINPSAPAASTPTSTRRSRPPAASRPATPTSRTSPCAPSWGARCGGPSWPATSGRTRCCCRRTTPRSSCGSWPTSPRTRAWSKPSCATRTSTPPRPRRCSACRWTR